MIAESVLRIDLPTALCDPAANSLISSSHHTPLESATFVAGPENRLSLLALERLLTGSSEFSAGAIGKPLVLVGPSGSGKTSLARAVVRRWSALFSADSVAYFTVVDFARELIVARTAGELGAFRQRIRNLRLLVLEDLQKLPPQFALHGELRETFDALCEEDATVLCTSQIAPTVQPELEAGLRDRLAGGLLLWLNLPGIAARLDLLRLVAADRQTAINERQLQSLAESASGSVPQVLSVLRHWELGPPAGSNCKATITTLTAKQVIAVAARYFGITQTALRGPARRKSLVFARGVVVYLLRTLTNSNYTQIGRELGRRDHSTIIHAMSTIQDSLTADTNTQHTIEVLRRILLAG